MQTLAGSPVRPRFEASMETNTYLFGTIIPGTTPRMGKHKRQRHVSHGSIVKPQNHNMHGQSQAVKGKAYVQAQHLAPIIPFDVGDRILLIGEADLSFARSLIEHHSCAHVTATVLEKDLDELEGKYPHVVENITLVEKGGGEVVYGVDAMKMRVWTEGGKGACSQRVGSMDKVVFNFPHVGGKSTDVNRQVRYNQELLVSFFKTVMPSVAPGGSIIVTLFEGEPYTLWNIRDLARHSGLQVERSFKFQASAYPGYHHARTFGVVKSRPGQPGGGWKGEDRPARSYIFIRKGEEPRNLAPNSKRKRDESSSDEDNA